jgi:hypothetical protein
VLKQGIAQSKAIAIFRLQPEPPDILIEFFFIMIATRHVFALDDNPIVFDAFYFCQ